MPRIPASPTPESAEYRMLSALLGLSHPLLIQILQAPFRREHLEYQLRAAWLLNRYSHLVGAEIVVTARRTLERAEFSMDPAAPGPDFADQEEIDPGQQLIDRLLRIPLGGHDDH